ncbi:hypothetical protein [Pedobacter sp. ASV28]|uniref:hypothetical protein n=1 Tax=Pedobacter sp. ASV28 TaxID=2795123 RepID=UPI0018EE1FB3|nr:hypothetical protein [Pedobacter sp. ASV28]
MKVIYLLLFIVFSCSCFAQKLPEIQTTGIWAPNGIRVDGKSTEWNNSFAAENKRTEIYYTVSNDNKNLYLVVKSANNTVVNKIMVGGITFTVNNKGKKKEEGAFSITYPLITRNNRNVGNRNPVGQNRNEQSQEHRDSIALVQRKSQLASVKEIKVIGFKEISDSLISIYNEYGIKAAATIDETGTYFYELAIPLTALDISNTKEFAYQIKLNGRIDGGGFILRGNGNTGSGFGGGAVRGNFGGASPNNNTARQDLLSSTDFWGKYILQKQ